MKHITLCADDYGQNLAVSQGIIALLRDNRLSATSCLTNAPEWPSHAKALLPFHGRADIGLHFNLTEGKALSPAFIRHYGATLLSLPVLMRKAYLRQLDSAAIEDECHAQLDQFVRAVGQLPDFIDGHQHVHQLPVVREVLVKVCASRFQGHCFYMRCVNDKLTATDWLQGQWLKKSIILLSTPWFQRLLRHVQIPHNQSFSGIYSFAKAKDYRAIFPHFLDMTKEDGLILCHPGLDSSAVDDSIAWVRGYEYRYLSSEQFLQDCAQRNIVISRFNYVRCLKT
ncbi:MAG: hypothetical protein A3E84_02220 [Gammaproteobacteria bacterium RIFCSPHIGHO2_12_FULL_42_13]|nr:MAG: hypothetical protein A3E84_02220 [Gammaproteobacteria bacterium RIFCSPHIGHO2_12_FULL_42_13]